MSNIKEDDLVQVVRWPCCGAGLGWIRQVDRLQNSSRGGVRCSHCKSVHPACVVSVDDAVQRGHLIPLSWLRKIPPLAELDDVQTKEEIEA